MKTAVKKPIVKSKKQIDSDAMIVAKKVMASQPHKKGTFKTQREAVYQACEELGDRTSMNTLRVLAEFYYGASIYPTEIYRARLSYRDKEGLDDNDCRTLKTLHRRDMVRDDFPVRLTPQEFKVMKSVAKTLNEVLDLFHSIDQMRQWFQAIA